MDERQPPQTAERNQSNIWPQRLADWQVLLLLLLIALVLRVWVVSTTEVPARDSVGFIRYALQLEHFNWRDVINEQHQHPGYSFTILLASVPIRYFAGTTDCYTMQYSAQLASSIAGLLLVIPMFYLGKNLFTRSVGFWGALVFQCLPCSGQLLSDAVSDPLFLLFITAALLWGVLSVKHRSVWRFALCGLFCGLTYLVRPEGALVLAATAMVIPIMQLLPRWRRPWKKSIACGGALLLGGIIAGSPYVFVTGSFSNKPSFKKMTDRIIRLVAADRQEPRLADCQPNRPLFATIFGVHISTEGTLREKMTRGARAVGSEFAHAYMYVGWLPVLVGLLWYARRYANMPEAWILFGYFLLQGAAVWWLTVNAGYVSNRHILPLVIVTIFQAVAATFELSYRILGWLEKKQWRFVNFLSPVFASPSAWSVAIVMALIVIGLTKTLRPMHAHRAGHHAAGVWLAKHSRPGDWITDDHAWAHFYSGRFLNDVRKDPIPPGPTCRYVVFSVPKDRDNPSIHRKYTEKSIVAEGGQIVFHWPENVDPDSPNARLKVYRIVRKPKR